MTNLKEVRVRIASITSTRQITSAMKMVSASKLRKGQNAVLHLKPYEENLKLLFNKFAANTTALLNHPLCSIKPVTDALVIIVAANRGLCGTFNAHIVRVAVKHIEALNKSGYNVKLWIVGRKAEDYFRKSIQQIDRTEHSLLDNLKVEPIFSLANDAIDLYEKSAFQKIDIIYNKSRKAVYYEPTIEQLIPLVPDLSHQVRQPTELPDNQTQFIFEPSAIEILEKLVPKSICINLYSALLDSFISEQGARMTAMHKATDNATELLKNLTLAYNKIRQSSITNEIVEIITGSEALNK